MRIVLITQDEPFFLARSLAYLLDRLPANARVVGAVLLNPSPFGKKETSLGKLLRTYRVFGASFTAHYVGRFLAAKISWSPTVATVLRSRNVALVQLSAGINSKSSLQQVRRLAPDLLISVAGNEIFRRPLIQLAPKGCLNLHSALLPKYRGLMPSFWVLRFGEQYTGVSVFAVDDGIDSGPILVQKRFEIGDMSQYELIKYAKFIGMDAISEAVAMIMSGDVRYLPNDDKEATYYSFPTNRDVAEFLKVGARFY
jgi:methionyl-tRNA formyltransferase